MWQDERRARQGRILFRKCMRGKPGCIPPLRSLFSAVAPSLSTAFPSSTASSGHGASTMSITLVSNSYLDENSGKIRAKPVPWEVLRSTATSVQW